MWFLKLILSFFYAIDKIIYGFISSIYDLLIAISRTTILSQGDIQNFYQKVYTLLGIFMLFKVAFSLVTYVVNPDDFSDKNKGIGKIGQNIIISLCMLVLVPYIFNMAYELQSIILEDNILARIIMGDSGDKSAEYLNTAGDTMAYMTLSAFVNPNTSLDRLSNCTSLYSDNEGGKINEKCFGAKIEDSVIKEVPDFSENSLYWYTTDSGGKKLSKTAFDNYISGVKHKSVGLMFRLNLLKSTTEETGSNNEKEEVFIIEYRYIFSTVVGVVVVLMLLGFCLDVALRSVKLAFLQIIAPIPIISYIDPKSGKDGIFKKWYKMCFSTYLSLFIRLLALYFAIYIICEIDGMTDVVTGASVTSNYIKIFMMIGVLMFAKQLPKILEGLGIKLDGDGKFSLNPLKKIEDGAFGGKRLTGAAAGFAVGALGNKGNPFKAIGGAFRGFAGDQGLSGAAKHQANVNKQLRQAKLDGSTFGGRMNARWQNLTGAKGFNNVEKDRKKIESMKKFADAGVAIENRAVDKIKNGEAGDISRNYLSMEAKAKRIQEEFSTNGTATYSYVDDNGQTHTLYNENAVAQSQMDANEYLNNEGKYQYINDVYHGTKSDAAMKEQFADYQARANDIGKTVAIDGKDIHKQVGETKGEINELDRLTRNKDAANQADQKYVEAAKIKK